MENIFRKSRLQANHGQGMTIEKAAEELHVDSKTLYNYEKGLFTPSEDMLFVMAEVYGDPYLIFEYFQITKIGQLFTEIFGFKFARDDLATTSLGFVDEFNDVSERINQLVRIVRDGRISEDEKTESRMVLKEIRDLTGQGIQQICLMNVHLQDYIKKETALQAV